MQLDINKAFDKRQNNLISNWPHLTLSKYDYGPGFIRVWQHPLCTVRTEESLS